MIITKLERQKRNSTRISVYLDDEFAFGVNDEAVYRFGLHKGMKLDETRRAEIEQYDQRVQAKRVAERYIGARMRSEREVRQRLRQKEFSEDVIDETLESFRRVRLIDDRAFAEAWVRDRLLLRPRAPSLLRAELRRKGIASEIIEDVLSARFDEGDVESLAFDMAAQYRRAHPSLAPDALKRRLAGYLQRKGFSAGVAYRAVEDREDREDR